MTVDQTVEYLLSCCRKFDRDVIHDTDRHGNQFCEMIIKNDAQPTMPITVTVTENGCSVSVGQFDDVANSKHMTPDQVIAAAEDIIADKIIFVLAYKDDDDIGFGAPYFSRIFALTGGADDMEADYEDFISKISKPINKFLRPMTALKGRFFIFNFSGSLKKTIIR